MFATLADTESRRFIQTFLLSTLLHQDPRYFRSGKKGLIPRSWYAATRVLVTRDDDGDSTFNTSEFLGTLLTSSLQNAYYPDSDRGFPNTLTRFVGALGSDATTNMIREFWPDVRCFFPQARTEQREEDQIKDSPQNSGCSGSPRTSNPMPLDQSSIHEKVKMCLPLRGNDLFGGTPEVRAQSDLSVVEFEIHRYDNPLSVVGDYGHDKSRIDYHVSSEGQPHHAKCSACDTDIDVGNESVQPKERKQKLQASFGEHVRTRSFRGTPTQPQRVS
jgi:hypothetical protein